MNQHFLYHYEPAQPDFTPDRSDWSEEDLRTYQAHVAYLERALREGRLLLAGRSLDATGPAIVIVDADSEASARRFMEGDPFVSSGLMRATLHPFRAAFVRGQEE